MLKSNGLTIKAIREMLIWELEYVSNTFSWHMFVDYPVLDLVDLEKFTKSPEGQVIIQQYISALKKCSTLEDIYDVMDVDGKFFADMRIQIDKQVKKWGKIKPNPVSTTGMYGGI